MSEAVAVTGTVTPVGTRSLLADAASVKTEKKVWAKRWSFGMGVGSVSAGTSNSLNAYALKNTSMTDLELLQLNSPYFNSQSPKTNIRHKTPVSVGLGVSYSLNDRFSLPVWFKLYIPFFRMGNRILYIMVRRTEDYILSVIPILSLFL